jgi:hypothetical protein
MVGGYILPFCLQLEEQKLTICQQVAHKIFIFKQICNQNLNLITPKLSPLIECIFYLSLSMRVHLVTTFVEIF